MSPADPAPSPSPIALSLKAKVLLLVIVPLLLFAAVVAVLGQQMQRELSRDQQAFLESAVFDAQGQELELLLSLAFSMFEQVMERPDLTRVEKQMRVLGMIQDELTFGKDGYFFVYSADGVNLASPLDRGLVGQSLWDHQDDRGTYAIRELMAQARLGDVGAPVHYRWQRPSTKRIENKIGYARLLAPGDWDWLVGTGLYDVRGGLEQRMADGNARIQRTFRHIQWLFAGVILLMIVLVWLTNLREARLADQRLRALIKGFVQLQVDERRGFARDLHDGINQLLVGVKFRIELARRQQARGADEVQQSLASALDTLEQAMREVRRVSHGLRPELLDQRGLDVALSRLTAQLAERTGIAVDNRLALPAAGIADDRATMIYRVVQEALRNIEQHARARRVALRLSLERKELRLEVRDDGVGFAPDTSAGQSGIGLKNMRERVELTGGRFSIDSRPGGGTRIIALWPAA